MASSTNDAPKIVRTERGLSISGTRITLYDLMDYIAAQYPSHFIRSLFNLSEAQLSVAIQYIQENRALVDAEYQQVLQDAEALRKYYEVSNGACRSQSWPATPETKAAWEKLRSLRAKRQVTA